MDDATRMKRRTQRMMLVILLLLTAGMVQAQTPVPEGAEVEKVADGFQFLEGPYWHSDGYLLFSDIPANTIYRWTPDSEAEVFRRPSGHSNGITASLSEDLVLAQHDRRISRITADGREIVLADRYRGQRLNSPNDVVVASDGTVYFTDPPYAISEDQQELDVNGVFRIDGTGELTLLVEDFVRPNGLAFSPDESRLYVNDSQQGHIRVFDVADDGTVSNGRVFAELDDPDAEGIPDGMKVDQQGNLYSTGPGGVWVFAPDGELLDRIVTPERATNVAWGGPELRTLYITASSSVYRIRLGVPGLK